MDAFAKNIRERAKALGRSNAEIARSIGINERRYAHYASGAREPDMVTLLKIAEALGTTPNELLGLNELNGKSENLLVDRLILATRYLPSADLESIVVQTEALLSLRKLQRSVRDIVAPPADRDEQSHQ